MSEHTIPDIEPLLKRLSLGNTLRTYRELIRRAERESWTYGQFLQIVASEEIAHRRQTRVNRLTHRAGFPFLKTIEEFDFSFQSTLRLNLLGSVLSPDFITDGRTLILIGKPGRGKTHLAVATAYRHIQSNFEALFVTAAKMIGHLSAAGAQGRLSDVLSRYTHPALLVVDELGYLSYGNDAANMLFHVVNDRYLSDRSMIFTTNKKLTDWGAVLHDHDLAAAIVDRLLERGRVIALDRPSMRSQHLALDDQIDSMVLHQPDRISGKHRTDSPEPTNGKWETTMRITSAKEKPVSIASGIRNAYIDFSKMTVSVLKLETDVVRDGKPVVGYGFNSNGRYAQSGLLNERFLPRLMEADPKTLIDAAGVNIDPFKVWDAVMTNEKPGGHGDRSVAVGVIDMAVWDLVSKIEGKPLYRLLAEKFRGGSPDEKVFVYAAGGYYYAGKGNDALLREMAGYLQSGYSVVKMKIGAASVDRDLERIHAVIDIIDKNRVGFAGSAASRLAVDANGRYDLTEALTAARALEPLGLFWLEEAGDPLDYALQAVLGEHYSLPMATGENLFSSQDAANLLRYGGMRPDRDYLQMDPVLSYGLVEYMRMLDVLKTHGWSFRRCIPHGGHQFALHIAAGLGLGGNESYPLVFAPFGGFADNTPIEDGFVKLTESPGIGFEEKADLWDLFRKIF